MAREVSTRNRFLPSLLGLAALSVVGFATGFAAGGLWDGPGLVLRRLLGEGEEVALGPDLELQRQLAGEREARRVAAAPPAKPLAEGAAAEVVAEAAAAPARTLAAKAAKNSGAETSAKGATPAVSAKPPIEKAVPAAASGLRLAIQVGAFGEAAGAEKLVKRLEAAGYAAYIAVSPGEGPHWRVRVGPYASREKADAAASKLKQAEKLPTWVMDEDAG
jgi:cell division septation protein DedD